MGGTLIDTLFHCLECGRRQYPEIEREEGQPYWYLCPSNCCGDSLADARGRIFDPGWQSGERLRDNWLEMTGGEPHTRQRLRCGEVNPETGERCLADLGHSGRHELPLRGAF